MIKLSPLKEAILKPKPTKVPKIPITKKTEIQVLMLSTLAQTLSMVFFTNKSASKRLLFLPAS